MSDNINIQRQGIRGSSISGQILYTTSKFNVTGIPANTSSISPSTNRQYITDNYLSGLINASNAVTASNPVADKKYTDDSISGLLFAAVVLFKV